VQLYYTTFAAFCQEVFEKFLFYFSLDFGGGLCYNGIVKEMIGMDMRALVLEMMENPMFRGVYDAKHGKESFMYGVATVMEYLAAKVDEDFSQEVSDIFVKNMVKSLDKARKL
jgi:hypothetical protein